MQTLITRAVAALLLTAMVSSAPAAETASIAQCQTLKDRIERYTNQRRKGGSAIQMQKWKEQMRVAEVQFRRLECKDLRRKLK